MTFKIVDPLASLFNVDRFQKYIRDQGLEVLKRVMSRFSYMSNESNEPSLLNDTVMIGKFLNLFFLNI